MTTLLRKAALATAVILSATLMSGGSELSAQVANPCAPKPSNPCAKPAANPCAPGGTATKSSADKPEVDPGLVLRPKGTRLARGSHAELVKAGRALFESTKLSSNGLACQSCHTNNDNFAASFAMPYPHEVGMAKEKGGVAKVELDEMIQFCMVVPMQAKPLRWDSRELAALTAYTAELQSAFRKQGRAGANPRATPNPCAPKPK